MKQSGLNLTLSQIPENTLQEPRHEKTGLRGSDQFRQKPGCTATEDCKRLKISDLESSKRDCTIPVAKTKALISCAVTAQPICVLVFAYAKSWFSHNEAHNTDFNLTWSCFGSQMVIFLLLNEGVLCNFVLYL